MRRFWGSLISITFAVLGIIGSADAESITSGKTDRLAAEILPNYVPAWRPDITRLLLSDLMPMFTDHAPAEPLIGHVEYCTRHAWDCQPHDMPGATVELTEELLDVIIDVNRSVNWIISGTDDKDAYPGRDEYWAYPTDIGDCEDYTLEKRLRLMAAGVPASALLITAVWFNSGQSPTVNHGVLTVRTDKGDLVLDNLVGDVLPWQYSPHQFATRQSPEHPARWEVINDLREEKMFAAMDMSHG